GFSNQFDPSGPDTAAGFTYSFDLNNDGVFEITGAAATASFTPPVEGSYPVHGRIIDKDGGTTTYDLTVAVANVDVFAVGATATALRKSSPAPAAAAGPASRVSRAPATP